MISLMNIWNNEELDEYLNKWKVEWMFGLMKSWMNVFIKWEVRWIFE